MNVKNIAAAAIAGALALTLLTACGDNDVPPAVATTTTSAATTTAAATTTTTSEPTAQPAVVDEPVIIECDGGPGPVITHWSDGTMTGSTPYCEGVAESRRQAERDHNADNWKIPGACPTLTNGETYDCYTYPNGPPGIEDVDD